MPAAFFIFLLLSLSPPRKCLLLFRIPSRTFVGAKGQVAKGGLLGMTPLCQEHFEKYNRVLPLIAPAHYPEETINAKLKYLNRVKERDTNLLESLDRDRPDKIEHATAEIIALAGNGGFKGLAFINISDLKTKDKVTEVYQRIATDLRECIKQIDEFEALKPDREEKSSSSSTDMVVSSGDNAEIAAAGGRLQQSHQQHEMEVMLEARKKLEALDPKNNKSIDAKEFLNGQVVYLPEPYLIVRDNPPATFQNIMGITFNNLAAVVNILAREHNYKIISTVCDNHTMYVFMEKIGSFRE